MEFRLTTRLPLAQLPGSLRGVMPSRIAPFAALLLAFAVCPAGLGAESSDSEIPEISLPHLVVEGRRVALEETAGAFAMPVTALRFEPLVDLQARNFGEAQGDVIIRGGIFENTGFRLGAATLFDPQTGHYFGEIPVAPRMLVGPAVLTGVDNAFGGFNSAVGTVAYGWSPIRAGGELTAHAGNGGLNRQSAASAWTVAAGPQTLGAEIEFSRSEASGLIANGDHDFARYSGRLQLAGGRAQTDLFFGYQSKFFGWPNLYTPFGVPETENLQTTLAMLSTRLAGEGGDFLSGSVYWRRHKDDYEFDRTRPGLFNPYQHETEVFGAAGEGRRELQQGAVQWRAEALADRIESTALVHGRFMSRSYLKLAALPEFWFDQPDGDRWTLRAGAAFDTSNRDSSKVSPLAEVAWSAARPGALRRVYLQYSEATQAPGYTALNSAAGGGLFRGNPDLSRERSRNWEVGGSARLGGWEGRAALFARQDDPLVDWVFVRTAPAARSARPVAIDTVGFETVLRREWNAVRLTFGYMLLDKDEDYRGQPADGSFYALNFARHRATAAVEWQLGSGWELRADNQFRQQAANPLRTAGGNQQWLTSAGLFYRPPAIEGLELSALVDNLWKSRFQEVPAVPAVGRQVSVGAAWRW
jgi:vitamin B12 transporter